MNLTQLNNRAGKLSVARKRKGRGPGSGNGKMAGRGHKGAKSRAGYSRRLYFEGGQMPLIRRLPKRGFNNERFRTVFEVLNIADLERAFKDGQSVGPEDFLKAGLVNTIDNGVKVLAKGEIKIKLNVSANKFSKTAMEKIAAAGGSATVIEA
ncbi:MAG: 50S ribosomal protein L15 [Planctomycetes bacterium]|nr:50S ribosomal protein L15 [Planctomycetota bacterium]